MSITLRCTHCDQSMTIAPRKPGSRVTCPACGRNVIVPDPDEAAKDDSPATPRETAAASPPNLKPAARDTGSIAATVVAPARTRATGQIVTPVTAEAIQRGQPSLDSPGEPLKTRPLIPNHHQPDVEPALRLVQPQKAEAVVLPKSVVILALVIVLAALACAFFAGFLFGKFGGPGGGAGMPRSAVASIKSCESGQAWYGSNFASHRMGAFPHAC